MAIYETKTSEHITNYRIEETPVNVGEKKYTILWFTSEIRKLKEKKHKYKTYHKTAKKIKWDTDRQGMELM